jgi:Carboxylesterase family
MAAILPSTWQKLTLFRGRRPILFWTCFTIILILMFVPAIVLGLFFRLAKRTDAFNVTLNVDLGYSKYQGAYAPNGVSQWLGIRYAAPPVGDLRFRAPADPLLNDTVQIADTVSCLPMVRKCSVLKALSLAHHATSPRQQVPVQIIPKIVCFSTFTHLPKM